LHLVASWDLLFNHSSLSKFSTYSCELVPYGHAGSMCFGTRAPPFCWHIYLLLIIIWHIYRFARVKKKSLSPFLQRQLLVQQSHHISSFVLSNPVSSLGLWEADQWVNLQTNNNKL
jgi:hypothetical protein